MEIHASASNKGSVSFPYRGYTIAVSSLLRKAVIFNKEGVCVVEYDSPMSFTADIDGIVAAKEFIDATEG